MKGEEKELCFKQDINYHQQSSIIVTPIKSSRWWDSDKLVYMDAR